MDIYKGIILYRVCVMTMSNLLKCWLCNNVKLVLLWISRVLETRKQCMTVFSKKNNEQNKYRKVDFLQIRHLLTAEMGEVSSKSWTKQGIYCTNKTPSSNRWTTMWLCQHQKWPVKQKTLILNPVHSHSELSN